MLINTFLDTEDFVYLYYPDDEPPATQGCGAGARMASKYPPRPPSPEYSQVSSTSSNDMTERERYRAPPQPEPPPHRVRAADLYPRLRTHYDEPGLDTGFAPICGESVQWVGRTADGGTVAMSNYRLHVQPRRRNGPGLSIPLRVIDGVEIRDLLQLVVLCKHGRILKCTFATGEQCLEWWRRLSGALTSLGSLQDTFAAAYAAWAKEQPASSIHRAVIKDSHSTHKSWFGFELERLGFTAKGAWRITTVNTDYKLCPSYPQLLIVPASIGDEDLDFVARFRAMRRVPAVVWRHRGNGAVIARSSQPEVGWLGWRSSEDERLLAAFVNACNADRGTLPSNTNNKQLKLLIVDARSYASAVTNRARGGGCECQQYYPAADIQFMSLPNIHHVRRSFQQMRALTAEPSDQTNWHSNLERTLWLQYLSGVLRAACVVARGALAGRPALVHCSDGWDRTPQIVAAAQLILDPYYRTVEGFRILIQREWLDFGHKFADRCGHQFGPEEPNERSPIFLQWLDVVHQMMLQYPCSFEFNEAYLIKLVTHVHSCMFGTFMCNTNAERIDVRVNETTAHVWRLLSAPAYRNHLYSPQTSDQVLWPEYGVRSMQFWWSMFMGDREEPDDDDEEPTSLPDRHPPTNGFMTKTRSCDNLLNEAEKRTTQRRCSDPSLAPDVMKLSSIVSSECESRRECRAPLTDSCVDELPALPVTATVMHRDRETDNESDQVDGLHVDHFENSVRLPRDIASGSSSLERELGGPLATSRDSSGNHDTDTAADSDDKSDQPDDAADAVRPVTGSEAIPFPAASARDYAGAPDEHPVLLGDSFSDVAPIADPSQTSELGTGARTRHVSITWRSVSESSNQSSNPSSAGYDRPSPPDAHIIEERLSSHEPSPDNHNSTEGDVVNHNALGALSEPAAGDSSDGPLPRDNAHFIAVGLNGGASSSSSGSESEGEAGAGVAPGARRGAGGAWRTRGSQLTLCPASPRRAPLCCHCNRRTSATSGIETSCESVSSASCWCGCGGAARCVCGGGGAGGGAAAVAGAPDPLDGLPPAADPLQARLHQIILLQKKVVDELRVQLESARETVKRLSPPESAAPARPEPSAPSPTQTCSTSSASVSACGSGSASGSARSGSGSSSASEVEVAEEARGVVWLPDSAAPRCQHCKNHFWLARRRHHCRRCGGIFCSSCSEMSSWGQCGAVRMCRRCRALR